RCGSFASTVNKRNHDGSMTERRQRRFEVLLLLATTPLQLRLKSAAMHTRRALLVLCLSTCCLTSHAQTPAWQKSDPGFYPLAIASSEDALWVCGPNESIASSPDGKT